jgi:hypothetical protein
LRLRSELLVAGAAPLGRVRNKCPVQVVLIPRSRLGTHSFYSSVNHIYWATPPQPTFSVLDLESHSLNPDPSNTTQANLAPCPRCVLSKFHDGRGFKLICRNSALVDAPVYFTGSGPKPNQVFSAPAAVSLKTDSLEKWPSLWLFGISFTSVLPRHSGDLTPSAGNIF